MKRLAYLFSILAVLAFALAGMSSNATAQTTVGPSGGESEDGPQLPYVPAGWTAHPPHIVVGNPNMSSSPTGLSPATIKSAYSFPTSNSAGAGQTIAIVDAYNDPTAENDLNVFSSYYGLPACTTANGCFSKVNQTGGASYPRNNGGWAQEISLDIEWAHAIAPGAHILLVEAKTNSFANLMTAEDYATGHASYVSNSWGGSEFSGENTYDSHFNNSGVSYFVSSGDNGHAAEYPTSSPYVISIGGTTLHFSGGNFSSETAWSGSGGGISAYENANPAQVGCTFCNGKRGVPDVSLDADPNSGVSIYDSTAYQGYVNWFTIGGTSASSPMWAAVSADGGAVVNAARIYGDASSNFRDITSGSNGTCGTLCQATTGYDNVTGRGSALGTP
jgi:subtilase family serine protease